MTKQNGSKKKRKNTRSRKTAGNTTARKTTSCVPSVVAPLPAELVDPTAAYAETSRTDYERILKSLVDIPSVSVDPARKGDIAATAEAARALCNRLAPRRRLSLRLAIRLCLEN